MMNLMMFLTKIYKSKFNIKKVKHNQNISKNKIKINKIITITKIRKIIISLKNKALQKKTVLIVIIITIINRLFNIQIWINCKIKVNNLLFKKRNKI